MSEPTPRYTVTVYLAAPGTPLTLSGGTSAAGHMYYTLSDGKQVDSYGFAPVEHGSSSGQGKVYDRDLRDYKDPYYSRTMEISREQYDRLRAFGDAPQKHGFDMKYSGTTNSCIDFTWGALNYAGLHRRDRHGAIDEKFEGDLKPLSNKDDVQSIPAPKPGSELNKEHHNPMPKQTILQKAITENGTQGEQRVSGRLAGAGPELPRDPLLQQAESAVVKLEQGLGRNYDGNSAKLAASAAYLAKESGLSRIDHVVLSQDSRNVRAGENLFVVQGALNDPAHLRAHMRTEDALRKPVEETLAQLQSLNDAQRQNQAQGVEQRDQIQARPHQMG